MVLALVAASALGADEAVYLMRGPSLPSSRSANGYSLEVRDLEGGGEVRVETSLMPIGAKGSYADVATGERPEVPEDFEMPARLRASLRPEMDAWEAATTVLKWISSHLKLIDDDRRPHDDPPDVPVALPFRYRRLASECLPDLPFLGPLIAKLLFLGVVFQHDLADC